MYIKLDHSSSAVSVLFENLHVESCCLHYLGHSVTLDTGDQSWMNIDGDVISSCGRVFFKMEKLTYMDTLENTNMKMIRLFLKDEGYIAMKLCTEQNEKVKNILKVIEDDGENDIYPLVNGAEKNLCECCKEQERKVKLDIEKHPLSKILKTSIASGFPLRYEVGDANVRSSYLDSYSNLRFNDGVAWIQGKGLLQLTIASVYSIHLCCEQLDGSSYTKILSFNSHGQRCFSIAANDVDVFGVWKEILESNWFCEIKR